jgi:hypothetical protein
VHSRKGEHSKQPASLGGLLIEAATESGTMYVQFVLDVLQTDGCLFHGLSIALGLTCMVWQQIRQTHEN